jgi:hypothetical protein
MKEYESLLLQQLRPLYSLEGVLNGIKSRSHCCGKETNSYPCQEFINLVYPTIPSRHLIDLSQGAHDKIHTSLLTSNLKRLTEV